MSYRFFIIENANFLWCIIFNHVFFNYATLGNSICLAEKTCSSQVEWENKKIAKAKTLFITLFNLNLLLQTIKLITAHKVLFWKQLMGFCCINFVQLIRSRIENKSTKRLQVMKSMNAKLLFIKRNLITFKVD